MGFKMGGRQIGGSAWAGVHGSFIGLTKSARQWKANAKPKDPKIKKIYPGFKGHMTMADASRAGLSRQQWQKQANEYVSYIEKEIASTRQKMANLSAELKLAERARQAAFNVKAVSEKTEI